MKNILLLLLPYIFSCANNDKKLVEKRVIALTKEYNKSWETLNAEKIATYHSNENFLYLGHGELACTSNAQFQKVFSNILPMMKKWTVKKISNLSTQVLDQNTAITSFILEAESVGQDGAISNHGSGALSYVWNKVNGDWKLIHIHESGK